MTTNGITCSLPAHFPTTLPQLHLEVEKTLVGFQKPTSDWKYVMSDNHIELRAVLWSQEIPVIEGMQCYLIH